MIARCCFHFIDYGVLLVICLAYQECFGAWRLDCLLWFSVLKYRSMQLTYCDSDPPPRSVDCRLYLQGDRGRSQQSLATLSASSSRVLLSQLSTNGMYAFFRSWEASPCIRVHFSLRVVLCDEFHRIYALKHIESRWWRLCAGRKASSRRRSAALGRMARGSQRKGQPLLLGSAFWAQTWVCQPRNHCTKSDTMDNLERVTTDNSVLSGLFVLVGSFTKSQVHVHCRDSRRERNLPPCCFVL